MKQSTKVNYPSKERIDKLLNSANEEDIQIGIELLLGKMDKDQVEEYLKNGYEPFRRDIIPGWHTFNDYRLYIGRWILDIRFKT